MSAKRVIVIGGGAGGMLAAGRAAEMGAQVTLLEKMERPGKKLLISGNARCNLTNARSLDGFISMYGGNGKFLYGAFQRFFRAELLKLLGSYGVKTLAEADGRIFPAAGNAAGVAHALERYMAKNGVEVVTGASVHAIEVRGGRVAEVKTAADACAADAVVLATGGASYPQTGSTGDGYRMAAGLGHTITRLRPALIPLTLKENGLLENMQGISLHNVRLAALACASDDIKDYAMPKNDSGRGLGGRSPRPPLIECRTGDLIFTHYGVSGPAVLLMSLAVTDALESTPVSLAMDLLPGKTGHRLRHELQEAFDRHGSRHVHNILAELLPGRIAGTLFHIGGIAPQIRANQVTALQRESLVTAIKSLRFNIGRPRPLAEAMVTAGGVHLDEVDPHTMQSKLVKGLYFCGEVLDIDADTGGFNLQAAFSTGWLAGESAAMTG